MTPVDEINKIEEIANKDNFRKTFIQISFAVCFLRFSFTIVC